MGEGIEDLGITIEFVNIAQLTQMDSVTGVLMEYGIWVVTLEELAILKVEALVNRSETKDGADLLWILQRMEAESIRCSRHFHGGKK